MPIVILLFSLGLLLVIKGGDWFVDSAVKLAEASGLPKLFIGATVVSIATTLPELIVSLTAAVQGETAMSAGNAIGSVICNTGFILAISCVMSKTKIKDTSFSLRYLFLLMGIALLYSFGFSHGKIDFIEGVILFLGFVFYMYVNARFVSDSNVSKASFASYDTGRIILFFTIGIVSIVAGSNLLVTNGIKLATLLGVPSPIISLTIIALGTSLPELVTCISSLIKKNGEIGVGNIIGANILNCFLVVGSSAMVREINTIQRFLSIDIPVALILTFVLSPSLFNKKISKAQGLIMLCIYLTYIIMSWTTFTL